MPDLAATVALFAIIEGIGVDRDQRSGVVAEIIANNDRLGTANKDRGRFVRATIVSAGLCETGRIGLDARADQTQVGLMHFDDIEIIQSALQWHLTAAEGQIGIGNAG